MPTAKRIDLWMSEDRRTRLAFSMSAGGPALELREPGQKVSVLFPIDVAGLRSVLAGRPLVLQRDDIICVISWWGKNVDVQFRCGERHAMALPLSTFVVGIAWTVCREQDLRKMAARREARSVSARI